MTDGDLVPVRIGFSDNTLREEARAANGRWDPEKKLWFIRYGKVKGTDLEKHIALDAFPLEKKTSKHITEYALKVSNIICKHIIL